LVVFFFWLVARRVGRLEPRRETYLTYLPSKVCMHSHSSFVGEVVGLDEGAAVGLVEGAAVGLVEGLAVGVGVVGLAVGLEEAPLAGS
jgi:hypothetical protein